MSVVKQFDKVDQITSTRLPLVIEPRWSCIRSQRGCKASRPHPQLAPPRPSAPQLQPDSKHALNMTWPKGQHGGGTGEGGGDRKGRLFKRIPRAKCCNGQGGQPCPQMICDFPTRRWPIPPREPSKTRSQSTALWVAGRHPPPRVYQTTPKAPTSMPEHHSWWQGDARHGPGAEVSAARPDG